MSRKPLTVAILTEIIFYPISLLADFYSWVKQRIIYSILKVKIYPGLFIKIPYALSANVLYRKQYSSKNISKILRLTDKKTAWGILLELENIDKDKFLEILECYDVSVINEYLLLDSMARRKRIMQELGIDNQELAVDNVCKKDVLKTIVPRRNIEELYDIISYFRQEASSLYQYGESLYANELHNSLSQPDQSRLIVLGLSTGDKAICDIINKHYPNSQDVNGLLLRMDLKDRLEIEEIIAQFNNKHSGETKEYIKQKIINELQKTLETMDALTLEAAFWIFVYEDPMKESIWVKAIGKTGDISSQIRLPFMVIYDPAKDEKYNLITAIRKADHVIHIHNHPKSPNSVFGSSSHDRGFARYWKSYRPELAYKIQFYIVQDGKTFEYA